MTWKNSGKDWKGIILEEFYINQPNKGEDKDLPLANKSEMHF